MFFDIPRREPPEPNRPPVSYELREDCAVLFRYASREEYNDWGHCGYLRASPSGEAMSLGKHFTTTRPLAKAFGTRFQELGWESGAGVIFEVLVPALDAERFDYLGPNVDGMGPVYFGPYDLLSSVSVRVV